MYEKRKQDSRWKTNHVSRFLITPDYFQFYNSFSASLQEKESGSVDEDRTPEYEFQRRTRLSLFLWFVRRNWFNLFWRIIVAIFVIWLCFFGGLNFFIKKWLVVSNKSYKSNTEINSVSSSSASAVSSRSGSAPEKIPDKNSIEYQKFLDQKKKEIENDFKPSLFFDGKCWLRNGDRISVGYRFSSDVPYERVSGKFVKKIDPVDRLYILDDDSCISMF